MNHHDFAQKFLQKKNIYNINQVMELRENWSFILPEQNLEAIPYQMLANTKETSILILRCKAEFFISCHNNRELIRNRINIYFCKFIIESIKVFSLVE